MLGGGLEARREDTQVRSGTQSGIAIANTRVGIPIAIRVRSQRRSSQKNDRALPVFITQPGLPRHTHTHNERANKQAATTSNKHPQRHEHLHKHTKSHTQHTPTLHPLNASSPRHSTPPRPRGLRQAPGMPRNRRASCHPPTARPPADAAAPL